MSDSIFSNSKDDKAKAVSRDKIDINSKAILNVVQRQKDFESNLDLINDKLELIDHNSVKNNKDNFKEMKSIKSDIRDLKLEIKNIKEFNSKIIKQIRLMSSKDEVKKLEKYIDLWNPMDFVSRDEFNKLKDKFEESNIIKNKEDKNINFNSNEFMRKDDFEHYSSEMKDELKEIIINFLKDN